MKNIITDLEFENLKNEIKMCYRSLFSDFYNTIKTIPLEKEILDYIFNFKIPHIIGYVVSLNRKQREDLKKTMHIEYEKIIHDLYGVDNKEKLELFSIVKKSGKIVGYVFKIKNLKNEYVYKKLEHLIEYIKDVERGKINAKGYLEIRGILMSHIKVESMKDVVCYCRNIDV